MHCASVKASITTSPRIRCSEIGRPNWSVSVKLGAGPEVRRPRVEVGVGRERGRLPGPAVDAGPEDRDDDRGTAAASTATVRAPGAATVVRRAVRSRAPCCSPLKPGRSQPSWGAALRRRPKARSSGSADLETRRAWILLLGGAVQERAVPVAALGRLAAELGVADRDAVAPGLLGDVETVVGDLQHLVEGRRVVRVRHPEAAREPREIRRLGIRQLLAQPVEDARGVAAVDPRQRQHEPLTAPAREHVIVAQRLADDAGEQAQRPVARLVAVGVVDRLEVVEVGDRDRERAVW